ncbi:SEA (Seh1-associated) complex subunit, partial [Elasticomyces elasticus]
MSKEGLLGEKTRALEEGRHDKMKNRLFKGVMEVEGSRASLSDTETPSNLATPLARPLPDSPAGSVSSVTSNDDLADIQPLPPSVLSSNQDTVDSSWSDMDPRSYGQFRHRESNSSELISSTSVISDQGQASVLSVSPIDQRSAPRAITGRADRRSQHGREFPKQGSEDYDYEQKMGDERVATRDFREFPKKAFSLESPSDSKQPGFHRHESSDSFTMFSASTESSHPVKPAGASFSPTSGVYDIDEVAEYEENTGGEATDENEAGSHSDLPLEINSVQ